MDAPTAAAPTAARLPAAFPFLAPRPSLDCPAFNLPPEQVVPLLKSLRDEWGYDLLLDVTAIDWSETAAPRYEVVYHLFNLQTHEYLRLAAACRDDLEPVIASAAAVHPGANWHERECYDMFGIRFEGHPDLRRILMWDGYPYFPLRKDFPLAGIEVPIPAPDVVETTDLKARPAPMMGGPFHAAPGATLAQGEPRARDESWTEFNPKGDA